MKILTTSDVISITSLSRTTIWRLEKAGIFPSHVQIASNRIGYIEEEIISWVQSRPRKNNVQDYCNE